MLQTAFPARWLGTHLDDRYRLDRFLGEGASSWVFAAYDLRLEREVAIKLLKASIAGARSAHWHRFIQEGRILASMTHPNVVAVYDVSKDGDEAAYLVMELSRDGTLEEELVRKPRLQAPETLQILLPVLGALACAHDRGILHRDIKPANIALARNGDAWCAKLLDFGIAKRWALEPSSDAARGTPSYMAPEQARGERLLPATDVWAMGVVFFRCLSGVLPFQASSATGTLLQLAQGYAPRFREACPGLKPHLAAALDRALEPDPERRYSDTRSFARAIAAACAQDGVAVHAAPDPIGLPNFERWLATADIESTGPWQRSVTTRSHLERAGTPIPRARSSWFKVLLAAGVVVGFAEPANRSLRSDAEAKAPRAALAETVHSDIGGAAPAETIVAPTFQAQRLTQTPPPTPAKMPVARRAMRTDAAASSRVSIQPEKQTPERVAPLPNELGLMTTWD